MQTYLTRNELRAKLGGIARCESGGLPNHSLTLRRADCPSPALGGRLYWPEGDVDAHLRALREQGRRAARR